MTGPFRPLFGPFSTSILKDASSAADAQPDAPAVLCPKARYKVAYKQAPVVEENPRLEMAHSQSSAEGESDRNTPAVDSSPAISESGVEKEPQLNPLPQEGERAQAEMSLVMGFSDSLSNFLKSNLPIQESSKPVAQNADSMQALLAGMNESLPPFPAGNPADVSYAHNVEASNAVAVDFTTAFNSQSESLPPLRDFFHQQESNPPLASQPLGVADHRFFQNPTVQKLTPIPARRSEAAPNCAEKRKADWEDTKAAEARDESEEMETDAERGLQEGFADKDCEENKSQPRPLTRTEEQRMKDRAKAKRHRQRKKVQEANDKATICHLEAEVERLRKALKTSEDAKAENHKAVATLEREVELWKTAYRDLGRTMTDMLRVGAPAIPAVPVSS